MAAYEDATAEQQQARDLFNRVFVGDDQIVGDLKQLHSADGTAVSKLRDIDGRTAVHWAASGCQLSILQELLRMQCSVDIHDESGWTALHCAVAAGASPCVEALLLAGADVNACNNKQQLPLHLAKGRKQLVETLLPGTKDCDAEDHLGYTPLLRAVLSGSHDAVHAMLAAGAEVNARTKQGDSAMHLAASLGAEAMPGMVSILRSAGVSAALKNAEGVSGTAAVQAAQSTFKRLGDM